MPLLETEENLRIAIETRVFSYTTRGEEGGAGHPPSRNRAGNDEREAALFGDASDYLRKEIVPRLVEHDSARFYRRRDSPARRGKRKRKREAERERENERRMHSSLRGYVTIKRRPAVFTAKRARSRATRSIVCALCRREPQPSVEQFSFFKQRQYVGSWVTALARNSYTHGRGGEGRNGGKVEWVRGGERQTGGRGYSVVCRV